MGKINVWLYRDMMGIGNNKILVGDLLVYLTEPTLVLSF